MLVLMVDDFPLLLTSLTFSDLYVRCVHYATKNVRTYARKSYTTLEINP